MKLDNMLKERIEYGKKLCKQEKNNWGDFTYSLIESLEEQLALCSVSQHRELLLAYEDYLNEYHTKEDRIKQVDKYLKANNCG